MACRSLNNWMLCLDFLSGGGTEDCAASNGNLPYSNLLESALALMVLHDLHPSAKLYGLLASLRGNRSLHVIRNVKVPDGYEALRQLTLALRPASNNRGLALMAALTSWQRINHSNHSFLSLKTQWKRHAEQVQRFQIN